MAEKTTVIHVCDEQGHHDRIAESFCQFHKKLLCLGCVIDKTKNRSPECLITLIKDIEDEKDLKILQCLSIKSTVKRKKILIDKHGEKVDEVKNKLEQKVNEAHRNLSTRIDALRDDCLSSVSAQAKCVTAANEDNRKKLEENETKLNEFIKLLSSDTVDSIDEIQNNIDDVKKEIDEKIPNKESVPQGDFKPNESLNTFIMQSGTTIGHVNIIDPDNYEDIVNVLPSDEKADVANVQKQVDISSDEMRNSVDFETGRRIAGNSKQSVSTSGEKEERKGFGFFKWLMRPSKDKKDVDNKKSPLAMRRPKTAPAVNVEEQIYLKTGTFLCPTYKPPKYLINITVKADVKQDDFGSACKFSKLVALGKSYIGMLSDAHRSLVFVGTEGQFLGRKHFKTAKVAVAAIGNATVAVLTDSLCRKFKVSEKGFETTGSFALSDIAKITGFDYNLNSASYAVSSYDQIVILDSSGKEVKCITYNKTKSENTGNIVTVYDFRNECLYILEKEEKILKSFSVKKATIIWKQKIESDTSISLRSICLHENRLYVACGDGVAIFSAETGKPIIKHETSDLLDDCLGVCVIDDVLVLSSNSDDFIKSTSLAYVSL